jgi:hypothetical protein
MTCRRYFGGNDHIIKTHDRKFPLMVTYRGATADGPAIVLNLDPPEQPVPPIPFGELTDRIRIEQAHLMIIPDDRPDTCGMFLSASFRTSGPTVITYRIVDAAGARSPVHDVGVGPTRAAFVSHEIDFSEGSGATIGFTAADNPAQPGGIAFGSSLVDVPSDNLRGYYRIETIAPHRSASNIVSYNLEDCSGEEGPGAWVFDAVVLGDPDKLREAFRQASSIEGYSRASAR